MNFKKVKAMLVATTMMVATIGGTTAFAANEGETPLDSSEQTVIQSVKQQPTTVEKDSFIYIGVKPTPTPSTNGNSVIVGDKDNHLLDNAASDAVLKVFRGAVKLTVPANISIEEKTFSGDITLEKAYIDGEKRCTALGNKNVYVSVADSTTFNYKNGNDTDSVSVKNKLVDTDKSKKSSLTVKGINIENAQGKKVTRGYFAEVNGEPKYVGDYTGTVNFSVSIDK